ncbi:hypothetical protein [Streptomyces sp. NBC_00094]|nr:hypothetical protein [Streptomyces sp. NBC_00094]MCX5395021.1 hypothetical protein [Streptomyces sp. NBC_00094]
MSADLLQHINPTEHHAQRARKCYAIYAIGTLRHEEPARPVERGTNVA